MSRYICEYYDGKEASLAIPSQKGLDFAICRDWYHGIVRRFLACSS
jgi:hypothetical protein